MLINVILLILGFAILIKGADYFVDGASSLAENFKIPKIIIGLTIVAFGTSAPEFAVSVKSILSGNGDIVLGNVIGSNILNILLILGISSLFHPLNVKSNTIKKELPIVTLLTIAFLTLIWDNLFDINATNMLTRSDGFILLLFFSVFIYYLIASTRVRSDDDSEPAMSITKSIIYTIGGIIAIIIGSNFVVDEACNIASILGVSQRLISLTIVALGTSLPELVTSVSATRKKEYDIAIGNVVGSNIFNIGVVIGIPVFLFNGISKIVFNYVDLITLLISTVFLFLFSLKSQKVSKREGIIFLIIFTIYYSYVLFS